MATKIGLFYNCVRVSLYLSLCLSRYLNACAYVNAGNTSRQSLPSILVSDRLEVSLQLGMCFFHCLLSFSVSKCFLYYIMMIFLEHFVWDWKNYLSTHM